MKAGEALLEVRDVLCRAGWEEVEVFHKRGRSRTVRFGEAATFRQEEGWAVRAGDRRRSFYYAASGSPNPASYWPQADGQGLRLPSARPVPRWSPPSSLDAPLLSEGEARGLFEAVARELERELPGARLLSGWLEDGSSESRLLSSREVAAATRQRAAYLRLEAVSAADPAGSAGSGPGPSVVLELAEPHGQRFTPHALARRLADRLLIVDRGVAPRRDRGEFLLAPSVAIGLLTALSDLWVGPAAERKAAALIDRNGRLASPAFTLIDDGRLAGGICEAAVDGEGQPTREVVLIEEGGYCQPLLSWSQVSVNPKRASGCVLRPGWRDLPRQSPTHLYLRPSGSVSVASLLTSLRRGYFLLALEGPPRVEPDFSRFAVPVAGFAIDRGTATGSVTGAWLTGSVSAFLTGLQATARDLSFLPAGSGLVGAPTILVKGLELRQPL